MNPNITLDQQPPDPSFLSTPLQPLVQFPSSDGIAFVKQEADTVEAMESYPEEVLTEYEVECILEKEIQRGKVYYLVKWKGFDLDHATWEPRTNLKNAPEMLKEFEKNWRDAQHAAQVEALNNRTRKAATSAVAKMKNQDSGNKSSLRKREKLQPETSTNGLVVTIKKITKDQNQEVFSFDEQAGEEAKTVEKVSENTKKKKVKEMNKKVKLNPESAQGKKKGKNNQITVKSENIFDPRDLMSHQMFMSMQKSGLLDGSIMGFHPDLSAQNILDSIKKENIDSITPSPFMAINMTHFTHQAISAGTRENSSSNNNSQGFVSGENGYSHHDLVDNRIGINIHAKPHESENNFTALARGMERQRLMDCSDSQQESDDSSLEASDSESVQDTDMEGATVSPYGSLENGDIPIKVIGVRPLIEENDLEIMMAWKPRPNGEKPEDSRVKRFDLLKRGLILPLIEYYEQNMQLGSAPAFNASLLAKKTV